jgi:hypothetical protein
MHTRRSVMRPLSLHSRKRILDMLRPQRGSSLDRRQKQRIDRKGVLGLIIRRSFPPPLLCWTARCARFALAEHGRCVVVPEVRILEGFLDG